MTELVYPRLDHDVARELLRDCAHLEITELARRSALSHSRTGWYETAPVRASEEHLDTLRGRIRDIAKQQGYPVPVPRGYAAFDQQAATSLYRTMQIVPADAAHEGVWSYVSLVLLPDVAVWRFPDRNRREQNDRLLGRPRNVFRRLWNRTYALGESASERLYEDEVVNIMERPSLGGDPRVARAIAETHLATAPRYEGARTELLREAMKRLRRLSVIVTLPALDDTQLHELLTEVFDASAQALATA